MNLKSFFDWLFQRNKDHYHPEKHYLRGPGPACEKLNRDK